MEQRFGARFREYRRRWAQTSRRGDPGDFPLSLDLGLNSSCQLSCVMCPLPRRRSRDAQGLMTEKLYLSLMEQAQENDLPALTLGLASEPLLHPRLLEWIELAGAAGIMDIRLGTNGQLLNEEISRRLIDSSLTRLEVSVDAVNPQTYQAIRGADLESLERAIETFCRIRSQLGGSGPLLRLSFLRLPLNEGEEDLFLQRWSGLADMISLQEVIWFPGSALPRPLGTVRSQAGECAQSWQRLAVTWAGKIWPCCSWYGEELLNFWAQEDLPLAQIWSSQALKSLRAKLSGPEDNYPAPCLHCEF